MVREGVSPRPLAKASMARRCLPHEVDPADGYNIINASETVFLADDGEQSVITVRFNNSPNGIH